MDAPAVGVPEEVAPGLRRILAPNPSPMTYWGTNTFLVGTEDIAVVDPGPTIPSHLAAILQAAGGRITTILVTHPHLDHSPAARTLARETGAPVLGFGPVGTGLSNTMAALTNLPIGGGEGVDTGFAPDRELRDGAILEGADWQLEVMETPGHFAGHLSFRGDGWVLSGDHAMAWASTLVSPPYGDISAFINTSRRLIAQAPKRMIPAHGPELADPVGRLEWLVAHRQEREAAILNTMGATGQTPNQITSAVYTDTPPDLIPAAERNVFAHLIDLVERNLVIAEPTLTPNARYRLR